MSRFRPSPKSLGFLSTLRPVEVLDVLAIFPWCGRYYPGFNDGFPCMAATYEPDHSLYLSKASAAQFSKSTWNAIRAKSTCIHTIHPHLLCPRGTGVADACWRILEMASNSHTVKLILWQGLVSFTASLRYQTTEPVVDNDGREPDGKCRDIS